MIWTKLSPQVDLGFLPGFLREDDPRPAKEQFAERYAHGGGWSPFKGFEFRNLRLIYPASDDGPEEVYRVIAHTSLRDEAIMLYEYAWVVILQKDGTWEVSRMD